MANGTTSKWLKVCLHYSEPWEDFLAKAVKPYIDVVMQTGVAERFFFQRSWENGPHICLWFKGNAFILESMLKPNLLEHFQLYFESRPSRYTRPFWPVDVDENLQWRPNNSVHFYHKKPILGPTGNSVESSLLEKQYQVSSQLVLNILKDKSARWTYNEMIGAAIKLHLSLGYSVGMNLTDLRLFFKSMFLLWMRQKTKPGNGKPGGGIGNGTYQSFQKIFALQKKDLVPFHSATWELFKDYRKLGDQELIEWFHENNNISLEIDLALEYGKMRPRKNIFRKQSFRDRSQEQQWNYCAEFIHRTNNRLGIHHKNEGYLYFVMAQSLQLISASAPNYSKVA